MDILNLMQRALDKTNDPDAIFALDRGITEIDRLREALQKIADLEYEDLPAPKSANETVLWVCLDRCITFAETALKEKDNGRDRNT